LRVSLSLSPGSIECPWRRPLPSGRDAPRPLQAHAAD